MAWKYSQEFREDVVRLIRGRMRVKQVSADMGVPDAPLYLWLKRADICRRCQARGRRLYLVNAQRLCATGSSCARLNSAAASERHRHLCTSTRYEGRVSSATQY